MNKKLTNTLLAAAVVGGGLISAGGLVANAYDTSDPTTTDTEAETDTEAGPAVDVEPAVAGLLAQVDDTPETDTPETDTPETDTPETDTPETDTPDGTDGERPEGERHGRRGGCGGSEAVAELLGLTPDELREAQDAGSSLADIAASQGVAVDDVIQAIVDEKAEHLAEEVAEGDLTQAEADARLAEIEQRTTDRVNGADDD